MADVADVITGIDWAIENKGNTVTALSDSERDAWRKELAPMIEAYLAGIEEKGVDNAREI